MKKLRKNKLPCINHALAFSNRDVPECKGMVRHGYKFRECRKCGWTIKSPPKTNYNSPIKRLLREAKEKRKNQGREILQTRESNEEFEK